MKWEECVWVYRQTSLGKVEEYGCMISETKNFGNCLQDNCPIVVLFKRTLPLDVIDLLGYVEEIEEDIANLNKRISDLEDRP